MPAGQECLLLFGARALLPAVFFPGSGRRTEAWRARVPALRFGLARNGKPFIYGSKN